VGLGAASVAEIDELNILRATMLAAKVTRDHWMRRLARRHPDYGWEFNVGYGSALRRDQRIEREYPEHEVSQRTRRRKRD